MKQKQAQQEHYLANKSAYHARNRVLVRERTDYLQRLKDESPCADCGKQYRFYVMDFDHRDGTEKVNNVSAMAAHGWPKLYEEIAKCDIVCSNCHRERTYQRRLGA